MSLLMEALRKAEQEKKEAAKRLREQRKGSGASEADDSGKLSLSLEDNHESAKPATAAEHPMPGTGQSPVNAPDLTLAPLVLNPQSLAAEEATESSKAETPQTERSDEDLYAEYLKGDTTLTEAFDAVEATHNTNTHPNAPAADVTEVHDIPQESDASVSGQRLSLENTQQGSTTQTSRFTDTQRGTMHDRLHESTLAEKVYQNTVHDQPVRAFGPATADAVFAAKRPPNYTAYTVVTLISLIVVGLAAFGVFYYFSVTPISRDLPSPQVARGVEYAEPSAMEGLPDTVTTTARQMAAGTDDSISGEIESGAVMDESATTPVADVADTGEQQVALLAPDPPLSDVATQDADSTPDTIVPADPSPADTESDTAIAATPRQQDADQMIELSPAMLRISRSQPAPVTSRILTNAWNEFQAGNMQAARLLYQTALAEQPDNRDALLGAAAVALKERQPEVAFGHYIKVLRQNPADNVAQAALISLQGATDPLRHESRIKDMLARDPEAAYLYFTLGNLYATQLRWPDAQQAFFDAYSRADDNADYAVNLAISLDRLGQPGAALEYYRRAILLAEEYQRSSFDVVSVRRRIQEIQER